jgi:tetraacyldisaccharide 4'-kinase
VYGSAVRWRRRWYLASPARQQHLSKPVISVGNLAAGGSGKTPLVASIARLLLERGERPSILSRGYARRVAGSGVTVVSDGSRVLADLDHAGDEPLMLARMLPGVPVLVSARRYESGRVAEERFGVTLHLLDDGFQHLALARDVDLLAVADDDLVDRLLPAGRLREPLTCAAAADALLVTASDPSSVDHIGKTLSAKRAFSVTRELGAIRWIVPAGPLPSPEGGPVLAVSGIARPQRFVESLAGAGWRIARSLAFADHHPFTAADMVRIASNARDAGTSVVLTTEKDAVRLESLELTGLRVAAVPLVATIHPPVFIDWLLARIGRGPSDSAAP